MGDTPNGETQESSGTMAPTNTHKYDESLLEAFRYIQSTRGKDVRGKMLDSFNHWFQIRDTEAIATIKSIVADLHNASLLVDDIEDGSTLRRGIPVAHEVFGVPIVLNTANYVYFSALEKCVSLHEPACIDVFVAELLNLHRGQGRDIQWRETLKCPTEEEYFHMIRDKTGGLFRLGVGLLLPFSTKQEAQLECADEPRIDQTASPDPQQSAAFRKMENNSAGGHKSWSKDSIMPLVNDLSIYFQIRDDLMNLVDADCFEQKTFAEDLTEGKFSFPVIHHIRLARARGDGQEDTRLMSILQQKSSKSELKRYAVQLMRGSGSLQYARDTCQVYKDKSLQTIGNLGGNPALVQLVELLDVKLKDLDTTSLLVSGQTTCE
jgi:geranylgeranyl diphosphate synthase, type III